MQRSDLIDSLDVLLSTRRSVRGFKPEPVPPDVLQRIFTMAARAPSNCNVQPWVVHVTSGATAELLRDRLHAAAGEGLSAQPDFPLTGPYPGAYRVRQVEAARALFAATGVSREDVAARARSFQRNFRFFEAPHAAFIMLPDWAEIREAVDCGLFAQSLMLAMTAHGIGSCAQGALSHYAPIVREAVGAPPNLRLLFGIAFGYEDADHPANSVRTSRAAIEHTTQFHT